MSRLEGRTISISSLLKVIDVTHPNADPKKAREGTEAHKMILGAIRDRREIPEHLLFLNLSEPIDVEKSHQKEVVKGIWMTGDVDLRDKKRILELKPERLRIRHALQLAWCCDIAGYIDGLIYYYKSGEVYGLKHGGKESWPLIEQMAVQARRILDIQKEIDDNKLWGRAKEPLGRESCNIRRSFDEKLEIVSLTLKSRIIRMN